MAEHSTQLARLWELCYLDPLAARTLGQTLTAAGGSVAAAGWLHVALAEVRVGVTALAEQALAQARSAYQQDKDMPARLYGLALCDEVHSVALRRMGDVAASAALQAQIDAQEGFERDAMYRFIAHNSRAVTARLQSRHDDGLRHFYAARMAADALGHAGPRITVLTNLGGYHHDLFNLEDSRQFSEQALQLAREHGAKQTTGVAAANLVIIYHALGEARAARDMVEFLTTYQHEMVPGMLSRYGLNLAIGHLSVGEYEAALGYLNQTAYATNGEGDSLATWAWVMARCLLARGDAQAARQLVEKTTVLREHKRARDQPYDLMEVYRVMGDACEQLGDASAALQHARRAHAMYEELVGRSARARYIALEVSHELQQTQRERDLALRMQRAAEEDKRRLAELNMALQAKIDETQMLHAKLSEQALRDPLTGLHNRRYLFEVAPAMLELSRRQNSPLCVVLLDLDHFKLLNDTFGHAAGDQVLQRFANLLTQTLRRSDVVCRYGGEEFVAVMPDIDAEGAQAKIEQLLAAFQTPLAEAGRKRMPRTSFSAGIAVFPRHGHSLEQLLLRADRGMYSAKNQGRARVELAPKTGFGALN